MLRPQTSRSTRRSRRCRCRRWAAAGGFAVEDGHRRVRAYRQDASASRDSIAAVSALISCGWWWSWQIPSFIPIGCQGRASRTRLTGEVVATDALNPASVSSRPVARSAWGHERCGAGLGQRARGAHQVERRRRTRPSGCRLSSMWSPAIGSHGHEGAVSGEGRRAVRAGGVGVAHVVQAVEHRHQVEAGGGQLGCVSTSEAHPVCDVGGGGVGRATRSTLVVSCRGTWSRERLAIKWSTHVPAATSATDAPLSALSTPVERGQPRGDEVANITRTEEALGALEQAVSARASRTRRRCRKHSSDRGHVAAAR